jgi:hypothetical protein
MSPKIKKTLIIISIILALPFIGAVVVASVFEDEIEALVIDELNSRIKTEIRVGGKADFSLLRNFPEASLTLTDLTLTSSLESDTTPLLQAHHLHIMVDLWAMFNEDYRIERILLEDAKIYAHVDAKGNQNFTVWEADTTDTASIDLQLSKVQIASSYLTIINDAAIQEYRVGIEKGTFSGAFNKKQFKLTASTELQVDSVRIKKTTYVRDKSIASEIDLLVDTESGIYEVEKSEFEVAGNHVELTGSVKDKQVSKHISFLVKGNQIDVADLLNLVPPESRKILGTIEADGDLTFEANVKGILSKWHDLSIDATFSMEDGQVVKDDYSAEDVQFNGTFTNGKKKRLSSSKIQIDTLTANVEGQPIGMILSLTNLSDPTVDLMITGELNAGFIAGFHAEGQIEEAEGVVSMTGLQAKRQAGEWSVDGPVHLEDIRLLTPQLDLEYLNGHLFFKGNDCKFDSVEIRTTNSDLLLGGTLEDLAGYLSEGQAPLKMDLDLYASSLVIEDFIPKDESEPVVDTTGYMIQNDLKLIHGKIDLTIDAFKYDLFEATEIRTQLVMNGTKIEARELSALASKGLVKGTASLAMSALNTLNLTVSSTLEEVDLNLLFTSCRDFGQQEIRAEHLFGFVTAEVELDVTWMADLTFVSDRFFAVADITVLNGQLIDYAPMMSLSRFVEVEELQHIRFSELKNRIQIADRVITIPKMTIESSAMTVDIAGTYDFDHEIDYQIKLNLTDLLAKNARKKEKEFEEEEGGKLNLYLTMTGKVSDPIIKYDRKTVLAKIGANIKKEPANLIKAIKKEVKGDKHSEIKDWGPPPEEEEEYIEWEEDSTDL